MILKSLGIKAKYVTVQNIEDVIFDTMTVIFLYYHKTTLN